MTKTVMFNPYTGTPRHPSDIASDPEGLLILEPGAPLRAAAPTPTEREAFVQWLRAYAGGGDNWRDKVLMGEHDIALALWLDLLREEKRMRGLMSKLHDALRRVRQTQALPTAHEIARLALHGINEYEPTPNEPWQAGLL